jgi:HSP20 family molecular chaperone IbpA
MDFLVRSLLHASIESALAAGDAGCWRPAVDVYRAPAGWVCKFELAGVPREDVEVHVHGNRLHVAGVRRDRLVANGLVAHTLEIAYRVFERSVELPGDLARCRVDCELEAGMLVVTVTEDEY